MKWKRIKCFLTGGHRLYDKNLQTIHDTNGYHLIDNDATVTVAHSKTPILYGATTGKDVVIYATPTITGAVPYNTHDLVIDLGNSVPHPDRFNCLYVNRIGQLTVSVLLNRFARKEHRA